MKKTHEKVTETITNKQNPKIEFKYSSIYTGSASCQLHKSAVKLHVLVEKLLNEN